MEVPTMIKKLAFGSLGLLLLASPMVASADTVSDIQAQIQSLLVKLEQLRAGGAGATSQTFTASPTSGTAPLSVVFERRAAADARNFAVDFGDGTGLVQMNCTPLLGSTDSVCRVTNAYTMPGMYRAELIGKGAGSGSQWQGTGKQVSFTVYKPVAGSAFATIDQHSLTTNSASPTITGTVRNAEIGFRVLKRRGAGPPPLDTPSQDYLSPYPNILF